MSDDKAVLAGDRWARARFDVDTLGYGKLAHNSVWIAVLFLAPSAAATALDARLPGAAAA